MKRYEKMSKEEIMNFYTATGVCRKCPDKVYKYCEKVGKTFWDAGCMPNEVCRRVTKAYLEEEIAPEDTDW